MRYISVTLLNLAIRTSNNPDYCPLAGPFFIITCMFLIITGGLSICHEKICFKHKIMNLYDITRGKPRAAISDNMEGLEN